MMYWGICLNQCHMFVFTDAPAKDGASSKREIWKFLTSVSTRQRWCTHEEGNGGGDPLTLLKYDPRDLRKSYKTFQWGCFPVFLRFWRMWSKSFSGLPPRPPLLQWYASRRQLFLIKILDAIFLIAGISGIILYTSGQVFPLQTDSEIEKFKDYVEGGAWLPHNRYDRFYHCERLQRLTMGSLVDSCIAIGSGSLE